MPSYIAPLILAMAVLSAVVWTAFPIHYWVTTGGRCFRTRHGRNIWAMAFVLAALIDSSIAGSLTREVDYRNALAQNPTWLVFAAFVLWPALAAVGIDRHVLLWRDQHPRKRQEA
jgi:hypothetical protein